MDSPALQPTSTITSRVQTHSTYTPTSSIDDRGAIQKRASNDRGRSISTSQADRLFQLATDQANNTDTLEHCPTSAAGIQWITPQHSPQLNAFAPSEATIEAFPQWTVPTPPRSDSGLPNVSIEEEPVLSSAPDFTGFEQPASSEMSSLGFLLPSQYGASPYDSEPSNYTMDQSYMPPMRVAEPATTTGPSPYTTTTSSSPSLYQSRGPESSSSRRQSELPASTGSSYESSYRRISSPYDSASSSGYSMPPRDSILSISGLTHSPLPSPHMSSTSSGRLSPHYTTSMPRSPNPYESNPYGQTYTTSAPPPSQLYSSSHQQYPPPSSFVGSNASEPSGKSHSNDSSMRVLNQRPKPQCWEHGCNGRQFSTFSNLLRHQREKSGSASKSYCPKCGAEFTRTTARNGHLAHDKCTKQQRRTSDGGK